MAFADPQSVTVNAVAQVLPRTSSNGTSGAFTESDGEYQLVISHSYGKRIRSTARLNHTKIAPDPFVTDLNSEFSASYYFVIDRPKTGYTVTEHVNNAAGLFGWATATSNAALTKIIGGES